MRVAFAIFKVFAHGGVARDLGKIVAACIARGHEVRVYAMAWEGVAMPEADIVLLPARGVRSHVRQRRFAAKVAAHRQRHPVDLLVGMNKMPALDVYYAGDSCFEEKARTQRPWAYRLTPRYRHFAAFERAVFAHDAPTRILTIAAQQDAAFRKAYGTPGYRFHALPPGIERDRTTGDAQQAAAVRAEFGVATGDQLLLFIGSGFVKKGLDRVLLGLAALPETVGATVRLVVVGTDRTRRFERLARRLAIAERVCFAGGRDDVPTLLGAADGLVLPAADEAAGMVILEAAVAGVPVLATANCGYAPFIAEHRAGLVTPMPYEQARFNADLLGLLTSGERCTWSRNGRRLGADAQLYAMAPCAVGLLERFAGGRPSAPVVFHAFRYAPSDPRYRDLVPLATACAERGLAVRVYACLWEGEPPPAIDLVRVPVAAMTAAGREARFRRWIDAALGAGRPGCVIGFDARGEVVVESPSGRAAMPCGSALPPGIGRCGATARAEGSALRARLGFAASDVVFAAIGGDLVEQGVERLFTALGALPVEVRERCGVLALGRLAAGFRTSIEVLGLADRTRIVEADAVVASADPAASAGLSWRDAIEAADVFVALPYAPASNGWVFDALTAGRAVLTVAALAESALVADADGGIVLAAPFRQADCDRAVSDLVRDAERRAGWQRNAAAFGALPERYGRADALADRIEALCRAGG